MRPTSCFLLAVLALAPALLASPTSDLLRNRLEAVDDGTVFIGSEAVGVHPDLFRFYAGRDYAYAWSGHATALVKQISDSANDGLTPGAYHLDRILGLLGGDLDREDAVADLDLLLTDAFFRLGDHLLNGRVDPGTLYEKWYPAQRERDLVGLLEGALASGDFGDALDRLRPQHPAYARLRSALARTRAAAHADLPIILPARTLEVGHESVRVPLVRQRLALFGEVVPDTPDSLDLVYTGALSEVVRGFQARHGLEASGMLDQPTRHALNRSPEAWADALVLNLERWRWLPDDLGDRHVFVNLPAFRLQVVEDRETTLAMNVVVGKRSWYTPVLSDTMEAVIFHPTWGVPGSIARAETLPLARSRGSEYLTSRGFNVYHRGARIDPATVDWAEAGTDYYFIQSPGPANPLGTVKFAFPNKHDIYIHDTNQKRLFGRAKRAYSHGCIRAAAPRDLAAHLLAWQDWEEEAVDGVFSKRSTESVALDEPVPVHLVYLTAHVDPEGGLSFYDDVYGHDAVLASALGLGD